MANSDEKDLMSLGQHCSLEGCGQMDFLPFKCNGCRRVYCLDHRTYAAHVCTAPGAQEPDTLVCPICARVVRLVPGVDPNIAFEQHVNENCDPSNYNKVHKKTKCPVKGCKEKLTTINTYNCKSCNLSICLRHRDPVDHDCHNVQANTRAAAAQRLASTQTWQKPKQLFNSTAAAVAAAVGTALPVSTAAPSRPTGLPIKAVPVRAAQSNSAATRVNTTAQTSDRARAEAYRQYEDPANSVRGTADRRRPQAQGSNANPLVAAHLPEACDQCGARFATIAQLIQHSEDYHMGVQRPTDRRANCAMS